MSAENLIYDPNNPNANIHGIVSENGNPTCKTGIRPDAPLCTGCCYALQVEDKESGFQKPAGEMCSKQTVGKGCALVTENGTKRPIICRQYHCSGDIYKLKNPTIPQGEKIAAYQRLSMANMAALANGEISKRQYAKNLERLSELNPIKPIKDDLPPEASEDDILNYLTNT